MIQEKDNITKKITFSLGYDLKFGLNCQLYSLFRRIAFGTKKNVQDKQMQAKQKNRFKNGQTW